MKLSKNQPGENNGHCWERFPLVSNPHMVFQPSCTASPPRTPAGRALCLLALFVAQAEPVRPSPPPHPLPPKDWPRAFVFGEEQGTGWASVQPTWARASAGAHHPRAEHPCRGPAPRCLPHYRKPLCSHCVGGVISEVSGDTLRSLLGWNLLARSDHSPLAAGTGRAFTKAWACDPSQRGCLLPWAATAKRDGNWGRQSYGGDFDQGEGRA